MTAFSLRFTNLVWLLERVILHEISERKKEEQLLSHNITICSTICSYYVQKQFCGIGHSFRSTVPHATLHNNNKKFAMNNKVNSPQ